MMEDIPKTEKKEFESKIRPYEEIKKEQQKDSIWIGVYDNLLKKSNFIEIINKCNNKSIPSEWVAIHLDKHKIIFGEGNDGISKTFLYESQDSVIFMKLYLVKKEQVSDIYHFAYNLKPFLINEALTSLDEKKETIIDEKNDYGKLIKLGELEKIQIISVSSPTQKQIKSPDCSLLKVLYTSLKKAFSPYSNFLIMYYLYRQDGVKSYFSMSDLLNIFYKEKEKDKEREKTITKQVELNVNNNLHSLCNTCDNLTFENKNNIKELNNILDLNSLPVYDSKTGEFIWFNENNYNINNLKDEISKNNDLFGSKSFEIRNGSLISAVISSSFVENQRDEEHMLTNNTFPENNLNKNLKSHTFIDDLNKILIKLDLN